MMPRTHCPWRAHPRSRGENGKVATSATEVQWLIPAHAGKTSSAQAHSSSNPAHPRSRGENRATGVGVPSKSGSSPLTRGKHAESCGGRGPQRLIPAHAGKTLQDIFDLVSAAAHPRSRGENLNAPLVSAPLTGSSPLTRGKPPPPSGVHLWGPAHPRSRGENYDPVAEHPELVGSSPLTRGKP